MNLQPSQRRQDASVRLGNHGYRLDGDFAFLEAELHIPPHCSGFDFGLELWACPVPHSSGSPRGMRVASVALELPTPITPHLHRVDARTAAQAPSGSADHAMVLMLVCGGDARRVHDFANYGQRQRFGNPSLEGAVAYSIQGEQVALRAEGVANPRPSGNSSGTLCLELWAFAEPYAGGEQRGQRLAAAELGSVWGQYRLPEVERRALFTPPPSGRWQLSLLLREWTLQNGYITRDYRNFDVVYERAAPEPAAAAGLAPPPAVLPLAASAGAAEKTETTQKLRLLEPPAEAPVASAAMAPATVSSATEAPAAVVSRTVVSATVVSATVVSATVASTTLAPRDAAAAASDKKSGLVSLNTAGVEELAKLPGLSSKVAKEIVKNRPFATLDELTEVRGVGDKTLRRIKSLLTL